MRFVGIAFLLVSTFHLFGQQALTDNQNGQWSIVLNGQRTALPLEMHELGNFDEVGLTYFMRHEKYGIINEQGEIVLQEEYSSLKQLGGGYYIVLEKGHQVLLNWASDKLVVREIENYKELQKNWFRVALDSTDLIVNFVGRKEMPFPWKAVIAEADFNHLYCTFDTVSRLFDAVGNEISLGTNIPIFAQNYLLIDTETLKKVVYKDHEIVLPIDAKEIEVRETEIMYSQSGKSTIVAASNGKPLLTLPFEDVEYLNDGYLMISKDRKLGIANKQGKILIQPNYASITPQGNLFLVRKPTGAGVLDGQGNELVPCEFDYVNIYRHFFKTHNSLQLEGLVSRVTKRTLLPCVYSRVTINDSTVRAWSNDFLRIINLDSTHRIVNDIVLSNVTSLVHTDATRDRSVDARLFPLGWFKTTVMSYDSLGFMIGERDAWGLKDDNDSVLISPRYPEPKFVLQADFSLVNHGPKQTVPFNNSTTTQLQLKSVISHRTGKRLIPEQLYSLDTLDLLTRSYCRFLSSKGHGFLLADNSILRADYLDGYDTRYVRYCTAENKEIFPAEKGEFDRLKLPTLDLNDHPSYSVDANINRKNYPYFRFEGAKWNFLDTNGRNVFSEPFDFAEPYANEIALVMKEGKWGVVRADSFVISPRFSSIKRSPVSDTLLVVKSSKNVERFLDTNGRLMTNGMTRMQANKGVISQIETKGIKSVMTADYTTISGESTYQKLLENGIFFTKEDKEFVVYNQDGTMLGAFKEKPEEVWWEKYVLMPAGSKMWLLSMDNDTLLPSAYKEIKQLGNYIFAKDGSRNILFDSDLKRIADVKNADVMVDPITGNYAVVQSDFATIFSPNKEKIMRFAGSDFEYFHNDYLISFEKQLHVVSAEKELIFDFTPTSIKVMGENGYFVTDDDKVGHYFNANWEEIDLGVTLRRPKYVGEGLAISKTGKYTVLFGGDVFVKFPEDWSHDGTYENGFLLMRNKDSSQFVNTQGVNQFQRIYSDARPFNGKYATVKENDGWTLINGAGNFQILPGFDEISPLGTNVFSTKALPEYGLYDALGNELIPVQYNQLNFLRNGIIQGRKNGEIFYFDLSGKPIVVN